MDLDYEQVKGPDELVRRSFAGQDWPWTDPAREQLLATRARMPDGVLFIDRLLRLAGVEEGAVHDPFHSARSAQTGLSCAQPRCCIRQRRRPTWNDCSRT